MVDVVNNETELRITLVSGAQFHLLPQGWSKVKYEDTYIKVYKGDKQLAYVFPAINVLSVEYL